MIKWTNRQITFPHNILQVDVEYNFTASKSSFRCVPFVVAMRCQQ